MVREGEDRTTGTIGNQRSQKMRGRQQFFAIMDVQIADEEREHTEKQRGWMLTSEFSDVALEELSPGEGDGTIDAEPDHLRLPQIPT